ncbi:MAG TPA: SRPBCC family protein [Longimicrobiales bacterium]|nr:SRPBCC family protein [Longimicrobiales bacterium]
MARALKRLALAALLLAVLGFLALLIWSPYREHDGFPYPLVKETVDVDAPCERVHAYLGNSANASDWSVFVDHITPLNEDSVPDGEAGSIRRSFRNADESGMTWDEHFEVVEPLRRRLSVYNLKGAPRAEADLLTEQIYEPLGEDGCRLSFTLFFRTEPGLRDAVLMRLTSHWIARIFRRNIDNVGRLVEAS